MEEKIEAARSLVLAFQFEEEGMSANQIHTEWNKVFSRSMNPSRR
jgi:hypothetical protein